MNARLHSVLLGLLAALTLAGATALAQSGQQAAARLAAEGKYEESGDRTQRGSHSVRMTIVHRGPEGRRTQLDVQLKAGYWMNDGYTFVAAAWKPDAPTDVLRMTGSDRPTSEQCAFITPMVLMVAKRANPAKSEPTFTCKKALVYPAGYIIVEGEVDYHKRPSRPPTAAPTTATPKTAAPLTRPLPTSCNSALLAGKWTNAGKEYAGWGVSLTVASEGKGRIKGDFARTRRREITDRRMDWPFPMLQSFTSGGQLEGGNASEGQCRFKAEGYKYTTGSPIGWDGTLVYDTRSDTIRMLGLDKPETAPWTRRSPPPAARSCQRSDIEGAWYRNDGTALRISATHLNSGGVGLFFVHPRGWPRGILKYSAIKQDRDSCSFQAVCVEIQREGGSADYRMQEPTCTLTLDPAKGTLSQGGRFTYSRTPSLSAEAEARRNTEAELQAQDRASEALNAEVTRRNAEAAARDQARKDAFARQQREYEARKKSDAAAYARAQAEYQRQKAAVEAQRQRDLRAWEAQVAACKAGDKTACAPK